MWNMMYGWQISWHMGPFERGGQNGKEKEWQWMIPFNIPPHVGTEEKYIAQVIANRKICGDGEFTKKCCAFLSACFGTQKTLLTTSGTTALDMAALLCEFEPGDEVILPSFTFSSTATAFVMAGAKLVFVDIRSDTMNIDESRLEEAITPRTKAIVAVHYAGVACEMDAIMELARRYRLMVVDTVTSTMVERMQMLARPTAFCFIR